LNCLLIAANALMYDIRRMPGNLIADVLVAMRVSMGVGGVKVCVVHWFCVWLTSGRPKFCYSWCG